MSRDQKKHQKQKKRDQKKDDQKKYSEKRERQKRERDQYPKIYFDPTSGDPEFVSLVRKALVGLDFTDPSQFSSGELATYRLMREVGYPVAFHALTEAMQEREKLGDKKAAVGVPSFLLGFGMRLVSRVPEIDRRRLMPYNDVHVAFEGKDIVLRFSSMQSEKGSGGTVFFSRLEPKTEFDGKTWTVAFSRHSVERICERINPRYIEYGAAGDVHALFATCNYYEPIQLFGGQPAFVLYDMCDIPGFVHYATYIKGILGEENFHPNEGKYYYKVGYCPVVFEGRFAKAKTFLYPGYKGTPEFGLIKSSTLSRAERDVLFTQATTQNATEVLLNDNPEAIKWFHKHGIPQVVQMKREIFKHYTIVGGGPKVQRLAGETTG